MGSRPSCLPRSATSSGSLLESNDAELCTCRSTRIKARLTLAFISSHLPRWSILNRCVSAQIGSRSSPGDWAELVKQVKVTPDATTALVLHINVQDTNRARSRDVANTLLSEFIKEVNQIQQAETQSTNARSGDTFVVLSPAVLPKNPVSPNKA